MSVLDIYGDHWDIVLRGAWHLLESYDGSAFRWAQSNAVCMVSTFAAARQRLTLDIEPGPGVIAPSFELQIFDAFGQQRLAQTLTGRSTASLVLSASGPAVHALRLVTPGGGNRIGADVRALDFRVFGIALEPEPNDIFPLESGAVVGTGWYPIEFFKGSSFRWAENDARVLLENHNVSALQLEIEAGPGVGGSAFALDVFFDDRASVEQSFWIEGRTPIVIALPPGDSRPREIRLHVQGGGLPSFGDDRVLNFRAFCEPE